jgi:hypothetical protein
MDLHIRDSNFLNANNRIHQNPFIDWIWDENLQYNDSTLFTDAHLQEASLNDSKKKFAFILEPPVIDSRPYSFIRNHYNNFDNIFTCDDSLLSLSDKFVYVPIGCTWINEEYRKIYNKDKMTSIIVSFKNSTVGQRLRHKVVSDFGNMLDVMGNGYKRIQNKIEGLAPYCYSVVIENSQLDSYFTEKIIDCFMTGTIPIYWGCSTIGKYFDSKGIIQFDNISDLDNILKSISYQDYQNRMSAIISNFEKAKDYVFFEKHIFNFLNKNERNL